MMEIGWAVRSNHLPPCWHPKKTNKPKTERAANPKYWPYKMLTLSAARKVCPISPHQKVRGGERVAFIQWTITSLGPHVPLLQGKIIQDVSPLPQNNSPKVHTMRSPLRHRILLKSPPPLLILLLQREAFGSFLFRGSEAASSSAH